MVSRYLVCDPLHPVVSVAGLCRYVYAVPFDHRQATLLWRGHRRADVIVSHRLYFLEPRSRSDDRSFCHLHLNYSSSLIHYTTFTGGRHLDYGHEVGAKRKPPAGLHEGLSPNSQG